MGELNYRKKAKSSNRSKILGVVLFSIFFFAYQFHFKEKWFGVNNSSNSENKNTTQNVGKEPYQSNEQYDLHYNNYSSLNLHSWSYQDWKNHVDIKCKAFLDCFEYKLKNDAPKITLQECSGVHGNEWVLFRDALDEKSNLTSSQIEQLKDYWDSETEKVLEKEDELETKFDNLYRPNKSN